MFPAPGRGSRRQAARGVIRLGFRDLPQRQGGDPTLGGLPPFLRRPIRRPVVRREPGLVPIEETHDPILDGHQRSPRSIPARISETVFLAALGGGGPPRPGIPRRPMDVPERIVQATTCRLRLGPPNRGIHPCSAPFGEQGADAAQDPGDVGRGRAVQLGRSGREISHGGAIGVGIGMGRAPASAAVVASASVVRVSSSLSEPRSPRDGGEIPVVAAPKASSSSDPSKEGVLGGGTSVAQILHNWRRFLRQRIRRWRGRRGIEEEQADASAGSQTIITYNLDQLGGLEGVEGDLDGALGTAESLGQRLVAGETAAVSLGQAHQYRQEKSGTEG